MLPRRKPGVLSGGGEREGTRKEDTEGTKGFRMLAKEMAVSPSRCVRQPGYISRVNDSGISISVSVRCPCQLYRDERLLRVRLHRPHGTRRAPYLPGILPGSCVRGRDGPGRFERTGEVGSGRRNDEDTRKCMARTK